MSPCTSGAAGGAAELGIERAQEADAERDREHPLPDRDVGQGSGGGGLQGRFEVLSAGPDHHREGEGEELPPEVAEQDVAPAHGYLGALTRAGAKVVQSPADIGQTMAQVLKGG